MILRLRFAKKRPCLSSSSLLLEASGSGGVRTAVRDDDGRVRPTIFVETKRTEEESLAFLTGSDLIPLKILDEAPGGENRL